MKENRRNMLKRTAGIVSSIGILTTPVSASGSDSDEDGDEENEDNTIEASMEFDPHDVLSMREFQNRWDGTVRLLSGDGGLEKSNLKLVGAWTGKIELENAVRYDGTVDTGFRLFQGDVVDDGGKYIYFAAIDSQWKPYDTWNSAPALEKMTNKINAKNFDFTFAACDPMGEVRKHERSKDLGLGVSVAGTGMNISTTTYVKDAMQFNNRDLIPGGHYEMVVEGDGRKCQERMTSTALIQLRSDKTYSNKSKVWEDLEWDATANSSNHFW